MVAGFFLADRAEAQAPPPSSSLALMSNPHWNTALNSAGYADFFFWNNAPGHPYAGHEMLSGEWAAAIHYNGVNNSGLDPTAPAGTATWLTDQFVSPVWATNGAFVETAGGAISTWDNPANPVVGNDTGRSIITNAQVRIQIDYEMADLGPWLRSPMGVVADPATGAFTRSDRYVMLQTYTITNVTAAAIEDVKLYQMLQGHPADRYGPVVVSVYDSDPYPGDPLASYVPFEPVHTVGSFDYDITQWNVLGIPDDPLQYPIPPTWQPADHVDYIGFSSTVAPDWIDNGVFIGHGAKPFAPGTHWDIEGNALNGVSAVGPNQVAGAEGWLLGALDPDQSVSHTVVLMPGPVPEPATISLLALGALVALRRRRR